MEKELFRAQNLTYIYPDEASNVDAIPALKNVSFSIHEGEYVAILGHNGSGKSTLAKLLNLILDPTSGTLVVDGKNVEKDIQTEDDLFSIRKNIGMVFQNPDNQIVSSIVEEDVAFGPENLGLDRALIRERVDEALELVHMTDYRLHSTTKLSGGQKQRIAIAGVLAMRPKCIIFDESTAMLDPIGRQEVLETMERLNRDYGMTILHITHYMDEAVRANRVMVIHDGHLMYDDTPKAIFAKVEELRSIGLDVPQVTELLYDLKQNGYSVPLGVTTIQECANVIEQLMKD